MLSWKFFCQYLLSRRSGSLIRTISWMSILGITIGVMSLIIVVSVMNGFNRDIYQRHLRAEPHLVIHYSGPMESMDLWFEKAKLQIRTLLGEELAEVSEFESQDVILRTVDGYFSGAVAKGLNVEDLHDWLKKIEDNRGRKDSVVEKMPFERQSDLLGDGDVLVGQELGDSLRLVEGDKIILIAPESLLLPVGEAPPLLTFTVRGFFSSQISDVDNKVLLFKRTGWLKSFRRSASLKGGLEVQLVNGHRYQEAKSRLSSLGWTIESWPERNSALFFALKMEKAAMTVFLGLSALITSFSILTVLILLVTQKRRDLGILMAMGLNKKRTQSLFTQIGLWLSGVGLFSGMILGVIICWVVDRFPLDILPSIYYDRTIPAQVSPWMLLGILVLAALIATLSSWLPARMCVRGAPAEALRAKSTWLY